jgi:hypothetical protein
MITEMSGDIRILNRRLGDRLGYVNGRLPRWMWMYAPEIRYWASRLGKVWVIAQWRPPMMSAWEWNRQFEGAWPYSANGQHHAMMETALPPGVRPNGELTQQWIWHIYRQMSKTPWEVYAEVMASVDVMKERDEQEWNEYTQDFCPAFGNWAPGARGHHVAFGGAKELYEQSTNSKRTFRASEGRAAFRGSVPDCGTGEAGSNTEAADG